MVNDFGVLRTDLKYGRLIAASTVKARFVSVGHGDSAVPFYPSAKQTPQSFTFSP